MSDEINFGQFHGKFLDFSLNRTNRKRTSLPRCISEKVTDILLSFATGPEHSYKILQSTLSPTDGPRTGHHNSSPRVVNPGIYIKLDKSDKLEMTFEKLVTLKIPGGPKWRIGMKKKEQTPPI